MEPCFCQYVFKRLISCEITARQFGIRFVRVLEKPFFMTLWWHRHINQIAPLQICVQFVDLQHGFLALHCTRGKGKLWFMFREFEESVFSYCFFDSYMARLLLASRQCTLLRDKVFSRHRLFFLVSKEVHSRSQATQQLTNFFLDMYTVIFVSRHHFSWSYIRRARFTQDANRSLHARFAKQALTVGTAE